MRRVTVAALVVAMVSGATAGPSGAAAVFVRGTDNVSTAIDWSELGIDDDGAAMAILARSDSFADALAAGALAGVTDSPFLVTATDDLDDRVADELERLGVDDVIIIGGTGAVSAAVEAELDQLGYGTQRLAGANRVATAAKVATDAVDANGAAVFELDRLGTLFIARAFGNGSTGFADSLGGGMLATWERAPMLVTDTGALSPETEAYVEDYITMWNARSAELGTDYPPHIELIGGTAAVSQAVEDRLAAMGAHVTRRAGVNRFATAAAIAAYTFFGDERIVALVDGYHADSWVSGFAAPIFPGGLLLSYGNDLPQETRDELARMAGDTTVETPVYCAPQVPEATCAAANAILNP